MNFPASHCSHCGQAYELSDASRGYTGCCNETVCTGTATQRYACKSPSDSGWTPTTVGYVTACCSAAAEASAALAGHQVCWAC